MTYYQKAKDLFKMIEEGKLLEALDKYYNDKVIIITDEGKIRNGKSEAQEYDARLLKEIEEVLGGGVETIAADEQRGITMVEFWIELKFKNGYKKKIEEVAVQQWEEDLIIEEKFYSRK